MPADPHEFLEAISPTLGTLYAALSAMNVVAAWRAWCAGAWARRRSVAWLGLAAGFALAAFRAFHATPPELPQSLKATLNATLGPATFFFNAMLVLGGFYLGRQGWTRSWVGWLLLNAALGFFALSLADRHFAQLVLQPDNVPIVAMVFLLALFTWLGAAQAVQNDERLATGRPPAEKDGNQSTLVWPDLVYIELITMVALTALLIVWSLVIPAPLEAPAHPTQTPNPAKAPWYFLGLQEMLVFFDASIAGVVIPLLIIVGLAAIPYLDVNPRGSGYYTIRERRFAYLIFQFGFLQLWIVLILVGTFFRGPNWNWYGLYEPRDPHVVSALNNVKLSEYFWTSWLGRAVPEVPARASGLVRFAHVVGRESAGLAALGCYFVGLPVLLGRTCFGPLRRQMGVARYTIMMLLGLMMLALPLKMILRWTCNLSYLVSMPEYNFNF